MEYGTVKYGRTVSTGDYGNVRAERVLPVSVEGENPSQEEISLAQMDAWHNARRQVCEEINQAFEENGQPAPLWNGERFLVGRWLVCPDVLLIVPDWAVVPGGIRAYKPGHRWRAARALAERMAVDKDIKETLEFDNGDLEPLAQRYDAMKRAHEQELHEQGLAEGDDWDDDEPDDWDEDEF